MPGRSVLNLNLFIKGCDCLFLLPDFLKTISYKKIWRIAWPIIVGGIAQNVINVTDTAFLGRLGEIELGASALGGVFYLAIIMLGYGLGIGTQIIVARLEGEDKSGRIGRVMEHSFIALLITAVLMFFIIKIFSGGLFSSIIKSENVFHASVEFISYRSWGIVFAYINIGFGAFYIGTSRTRIITWSTLVMAAVNVFLDYALIFGNLGFPEMGLKGAAIASVAAEILVSVYFCFYTFFYTDIKKYRIFEFHAFDLPVAKRVFFISGPVMLQNFLSLFAWFGFFALVENLGERELAISNIVRSVYVILMIPIWGFAAASNTLVSFLIGRRHGHEVLPVVYKTSALCFLLVLAFVIPAMLFPVEILMIYTTDAGLIAQSLPVLRVVSGSVICFAFAMVFYNAVSGTGKTGIALIMELFVVGFYFLAAYLMVIVFRLPVAVVWTVEFLYAGCLLILSWLYLKFGNWQEK